MNPQAITLAENNLKQLDPILGKLIATQTLEPLNRPTDYFESLTRSIIGQQVSVAAARAIFGRLQAATGLQPQKILMLSDDAVRAVGLSKQKTSYIRDLAQHFHDDPAIYNHLDSLPDDEIIRDLTAIKGIGEWTAQMFLMFTLHRPDVFAPGDGGLQRAMMKLYGWQELPPKKELETTAEAWQPYRTIACLHLWHSLDNQPN